MGIFYFRGYLRGTTGYSTAHSSCSALWVPYLNVCDDVQKLQVQVVSYHDWYISKRQIHNHLEVPFFTTISGHSAS
jgi:hypothetical protein